MKNLEICFNRYIGRYKNILSLGYPSEERMGITERNLTVNFAIEAEKILGNTITWYEVPINNTQKEKSDNHLDAVIINQQEKEILLIESKRLRESRTLNAIYKDIARISNKGNIDEIKKRFSKDNIKAYKAYGIILFDLWTSNSANKNKWNKAVFDSIEGGCFYKDYLEKMCIENNIQERFESIQHYIANVDDAANIIEGYSYNLGALVFKIKSNGE